MCPLWAEKAAARLRAPADGLGTESRSRDLPALLVRVATGANANHQPLRSGCYEPGSPNLPHGQHEGLFLRWKRAGPNRYFERRLDQVVMPAILFETELACRA